MTQRTAKLGSFAPGLNNRREPTQLDIVLSDRSKATYLSAADNVDLSEKGYLKRRRGTTLALPGRAHSIWCDGKNEDEGYAVVGNQLVRCTNAEGTLQGAVVLSGMVPGPISFSRASTGDVYWSNGQDIGRFVAGVARPVVTPEPSVIPALTLGTGGIGLPPGRYLVAFTRQTIEDGESAATPVQTIEVPVDTNPGCIFIDDTEGCEVYISGPNGDVLAWAGTGLASISGPNPSGRRCQTLNLTTMLPGSIVRHYAGRMLVAAGNLLLVSEPYYFGLFNPSSGYVPFPAPITVVEPTPHGVFICADKTYFITDLLGGELEAVLPYGGIAGTGGSSIGNEQVYWQSERGLIVGSSEGKVKAVQDDTLRFAPAAAGASLYREQDGMTHIVASRSGTRPGAGAASSYMEAEVIRQGTTL